MSNMQEERRVMQIGEHSIVCTFVFEKRNDGESDLWEGHCLELDCYAAATALESALREIISISQEMFVEYLNHGGPERLASRRAPQMYWDALEARRGSAPAMRWSEVCSRQADLQFVATSEVLRAVRVAVVHGHAVDGHSCRERTVDFWEERMTA